VESTATATVATARAMAVVVAGGNRYSDLCLILDGYGDVLGG